MPTERAGVEAKDESGLTPPWSRTNRPVPRLVIQPLQEFLQQETAGAVLLLAAAVVALVWANSPWSDSYRSLWRTSAALGVGSHAIAMDLRHWVNDGLMTLFFLVVGLEIKRELVTGELRDRRTAVLPVLAAIGGMVVPAVLYLAIAGSRASRGWGIAMPTDIAFALGVLALAGRGAPPGLKAFLLALAIVDDLGSIVVIAVAYSSSVAWVALAVASATVVLFVVLQRLQIRATTVFLALGLALWVALEHSGATPTLAGVAIGLLFPAVPVHRPKAVSAEAHRVADETVDDPSPPDADAPQWLHLARLSREAVSPLARAERLLHPWTALLVLPLFALANAGISLAPSTVGPAASSRVAAAVVVARVLGKPLGVAVGAFLAVRVRVARLPNGVGWPSLLAAGATAGVPFAVSLFVAELALPASLVYEATVGILIAAIAAGIVGAASLVLVAGGRGGRRNDPAEAAAESL